MFEPVSLGEDDTDVPLIDRKRGEPGGLPRLSASRDLDRDLALFGLICIAIGGLRSKRGVERESEGDECPETEEVETVEIVARGGPLPKEGDR